MLPHGGHLALNGMGWKHPLGVSRGWPGQSLRKGPTGDNLWGMRGHLGVPKETAQDLLQGFLRLQKYGQHPLQMLWSRVSGLFSSQGPSQSLLQTPSTGGSPTPAHLPVLLSPGTGTGLAQARGGNLSCWSWGFGAAFCRGFVWFGFSTAYFSLANVWEKGVLCYRLNSPRSSSQLVRGGSRWALGS